MSVSFKHNTASQSEILHHLQCVSSAFVLDLSQRVNLEEYSQKLFSLAEREEAWCENELIGLVAYYINSNTQTAFITNVSVDTKYQNKGIATRLISKVTEFSKDKSLRTISLEVADDEKLLKFYTKLGFVVNQKETDCYELTMSLAPIVAIRCTVFNHEPYLRDCLEGFVMQQTNFPFVAIVHDDASTDGSAAIIREYAEKYPHIIKPIFETENQFSKGVGTLGRIMNTAIESTGAKYVAMCEGDDYWTDPLKLQKQVDFMEANPDYSMCFHGSEIKNETQFNPKIQCLNISNRDYSATEVLAEWIVPTASILYKKNIVNKFNIVHPEWILYGDIILVEKCCHVGKIYGMTEKMSVYRMQKLSMVHNPNNTPIKIRKMPDHYKCLSLNFNLIDRSLLSWLLAQSYYSRFRYGEENFWFRICDFIMSLYYKPSFIFSKFFKPKNNE